MNTLVNAVIKTVVLVALALNVSATAQAQTLNWIRNKADAMAAARAEGKLVLLLAGRDTCSNCKTMKNTVSESQNPPVKALLQENFILWYSIVDTSPDYRTYTGGLPASWSLPLICAIDPAKPNEYLSRSTGIQQANTFYQRLLSHVNARPRLPVVVSFTPTQGFAGTEVTIQGDNLTNVTAVQFNGVDASFTVEGGLKAIVPATATTGPIVVKTTAGQAASTASFTLITVTPGRFSVVGFADLLLQRQDSTMAVWMLEGATLVGGAFLDPMQPGEDWQVIGRADFDLDGKPDLLMQDTQGFLRVWHMNGLKLKNVRDLNPIRSLDGRPAVGVGHFNEDEYPDILFQHSDGSLQVWFMNGLEMIADGWVNPLAPADAAYRAVSVGDLNGDKKDDIVFQHSENATLAVWFMDGLNMKEGWFLNPSAPADPAFKASAVVDCDKDGKSDIVLTNGKEIAIWFMNGADLVRGEYLNVVLGESNWSIVGP
jgi:hypothetical protein